MSATCGSEAHDAVIEASAHKRGAGRALGWRGRTKRKGTRPLHPREREHRHDARGRGLGVGLLHADSADEALRRGELLLLYRPEARISVRFAYLEVRANDPLLSTASGILQEGAPP